MAVAPRATNFTFALDIARFADTTKNNVNLVVRKATLDIFSRVVVRTPVDTGRARGNWLPSFRTPASGYDWDKYSHTGQETIAAIAALFVGMKAGQVAWLSNNLPYVWGLEFDAVSRQAPNGMARLSVREYADYLSRTGLGILRAL